jgi:hypothetical protein
MTTTRVPGFLPSTNGFHFDNNFPSQPAITIDLGVVKIPIGNAANGLCGGMVFAACDYFAAGRLPPPDTCPPPAGAPLFGYLVRRILDSYHLPVGPAIYYALMSPAMPDGDRQKGPVTIHGRAWRVIAKEWPAIRADLDAGRLCPLGIVKVKSVNPARLGQNHQVLAYGYDLNGTQLDLRLYDPNSADNDAVTLSLDISHPERPTTLTMAPVSCEIPNVFSIFRVAYRASTPPTLAGPAPGLPDPDVGSKPATTGSG